MWTACNTVIMTSKAVVPYRNDSLSLSIESQNYHSVDTEEKNIDSGCGVGIIVRLSSTCKFGFGFLHYRFHTQFLVQLQFTEDRVRDSIPIA